MRFDGIILSFALLMCKQSFLQCCLARLQLFLLLASVAASEKILPPKSVNRDLRENLFLYCIEKDRVFLLFCF